MQTSTTDTETPTTAEDMAAIARWYGELTGPSLRRLLAGGEIMMRELAELRAPTHSEFVDGKRACRAAILRLLDAAGLIV